MNRFAHPVNCFDHKLHPFPFVFTYLLLRAHLPFSRFVHTRHGLANKGIPARSFRAADYVWVTSEFVRDEFIALGIQPRRDYWITGYIQMDNLFSATRPAQIPARRNVRPRGIMDFPRSPSWNAAPWSCCTEGVQTPLW